MGFTLAVVERAHRGAVEQQYAHVLWLAHGLHRQTPMTVLLRGVAAVYALDGPQPPPVRVGGLPWGATPDYGDALARLDRDGAPVVVCAASLAALGLAGRPLRGSVRPVSEVEIVALFAESERIWYL